MKNRKVRIYAKKKDGMAILTFKVQPPKSETIQISSGFKVPLECWENDMVVNHPEAIELNQKIKELRDNYQFYFEKLMKVGTVTKDSLKKMMKASKIGIDEFMVKEIEILKSELKSGRLSVQPNTLSLILSFQEFYGKKPISEIDEKWLNDFFDYLLTKNYSKEYVKKIMNTTIFYLKKFYDGKDDYRYYGLPNFTKKLREM